MKIAISSQGDNLDSLLDSRLGRAKFFIIYDTEQDSFEVIDNSQNLNAVQGAGIQAAQSLVATGIEALISGQAGPKAFTVLKQANIAIYKSPVQSIKAVIEAFKKAELAEADSADATSHWR